jgi:hypothetical protein
VTSVAVSSGRFMSDWPKTVRQKLLNKRDIVQEAGLCETTLLQKVALVLINKSLPAVPGFRRLGRRHSDLAQHRQKTPQRGGFGAMDNMQIALQKSLNSGFIHPVQVNLPGAEPVAEPGDCIHLHRNRRGQKTL